MKNSCIKFFISLYVAFILLKLLKLRSLLGHCVFKEREKDTGFMECFSIFDVV